MKKSSILFATVSLILSMTACSQAKHTTYEGGLFGNKTVKASDRYVTKNIKVGSFDKVSIAGSQDVIYEQKSGAPSVEVYTSDNIIDLLDIRVQDRTLFINFKEGVSVSYEKMKIQISSDILENVSIAGSGDFLFTNGLKSKNDLCLNIAGSGDIEGEDIACKDLQLSIAGSGDMDIKKITALDIKANIAGSGDITLTGTAQKASYGVMGSGNITASDLEAKEVHASTSGSGDIQCFATESLKAYASGSGDIGYKGNPSLNSTQKGIYKL